MRVGGGKAKGAQFERTLCKRFSLWVSDGKNEDLFWRTAMSGGRSTVALRRGVLIRQAGDMCAVAPEGIPFCAQWIVEHKHVKHLALDSFLITHAGPLHKFWKKLVKEAERVSRDPMLVALQNRWPILVITKHNHVAQWAQPIITTGAIDITLFDSMLRRSYDTSR